MDGNSLVFRRPKDFALFADGFAAEYQVADASELARFGLQAAGIGGHYPIGAEGHLWRYHPPTGNYYGIPWTAFDAWVMGQSAIEFQSGEDDAGRPRFARVKVQNLKAIRDMALSAAHANADHSPNVFANAPAGLCFKDGFLAIEGENLVWRGHSPRHFQRQGFDFAFPDENERLSCPLFERYMRDITPEGSDGEEVRGFLQRWAGIALLGLATQDGFRRALILYGPKGTGKSQLCDIIAGLFPDGALSHVQPHDFGNKDLVPGLAGRRLNVVEELQGDHIPRQERLKSIIDGSPVQVKEAYIRQYTFHPQAAHLFAANKLPAIHGADPSVWDRFALLEFKQRFRGTGKQIVRLASRILQSEKRALVQWALAGAVAALSERRLEIPACMQHNLDSWRSSADPVAEWATDHVKAITEPSNLPPSRSLSSFPTLSQLLGEFTAYAKANNYKSVSLKEFRQRLIAFGLEIERSNGARVLCEFEPFEPVGGRLDDIGGGI